MNQLRSTLQVDKTMSERGVIIAFCTQKGGTGKTTLATNCSAESARRGYRTLLVDADIQQRSSANWADRRDLNIEGGYDWPRVNITEKKGRIRNMLLEHAKDYDVVVVDPAGRDSIELRSTLGAADIIIIPTQVSYADLDTLPNLVKWLEETEDMNPTRIVRSVITQAPTIVNNNERKEAREILKDFISHFPLAKTTIYNRKVYRLTHSNGMSVNEYKDSKAKGEIQNLMSEILSYA